MVKVTGRVIIIAIKGATCLFMNKMSTEMYSNNKFIRYWITYTEGYRKNFFKEISTLNTTFEFRKKDMIIPDKYAKVKAIWY